MPALACDLSGITSVVTVLATVLAVPPGGAAASWMGTFLRFAHDAAFAISIPRLWCDACSRKSVTDTITNFEDLAVVLDGELHTPGILKALSRANIPLLAFSFWPVEGKTQLDMVTEDGHSLQEALRKMGLALKHRKPGLMIQGEERPDALAKLLERMEDAQVDVIGVEALPATEGNFAVMLWISSETLEQASNALRGAALDPVAQASKESFPASDSPAWSLPVES
jgi:hypothetical protein